MLLLTLKIMVYFEFFIDRYFMIKKNNFFLNLEPNVKFDIENTEKQNIEPPNNQNLDESYLTEYERDVREEMARNIDTESRLDYIQSANDLANNNEKKKVDPKSELPELSIDTLIIDFSPINFIDSVGIKTIYQVLINLYSNFFS